MALSAGDGLQQFHSRERVLRFRLGWMSILQNIHEWRDDCLGRLLLAWMEQYSEHCRDVQRRGRALRFGQSGARGIGIAVCGERFFGVSLSIQLWVESSAVMPIALRCGMGRMKHVAVDMLWVPEAV